MPSYEDVLGSATHELMEFEIGSESQKYSGYTLFSKHYFCYLKEEENYNEPYAKSVTEMLQDMLIEADESISEEDEESYDSDSVKSSTTTSTSDVIAPCRNMANMWNGQSARNQSFWRLRAVRLNAHPLVGSFCAIPECLLDSERKLSSTKVLMGIREDWCRFVKICRSALGKYSSQKESISSYKFLNEKVNVGLQSYRALSMSTLLIHALFGEQFSNELIQNDMVYQRKKRVFMYFASYRKIQEVFGINEYSAMTFTKRKNTYFCCGKVNVKYEEKSIIGYVMDEDDVYFKVLLSNNIGVKCKKPLVVSQVVEDGKITSVRYDYDVGVDHDNIDYSITQFWPVRFKFQRNSIHNCQFMLNKVVLDENNTVNINLSS